MRCGCDLTRMSSLCISTFKTAGRSYVADGRWEDLIYLLSAACPGVLTQRRV